MEPQVEHLEGHIARLTVKVDDDLVERGRRAAAKRIARDLRIPGFRPGKAPYSVVVQYVGEEGIIQEALEDIGNEVYRNALEAAGIEPYSSGEITDLDVSDGLTLVFEVPLRPVVKLNNYREIRLDYEETEVNDDDIHQSIYALLQSLALTEHVDRPSAYDDIMVLNIKAVIKHTADAHGEDHDKDETEADATTESSVEIAAEDTDVASPVDEVETVKDTEDNTEDKIHDNDHGHEHVVMDEQQFKYHLSEDNAEDVALGFSQQLLGLKVGEHKTFSLTFPEDDERFPNETLHYDVTVTAVQNLILPEVDDFMAELITNGDIKTLDELRESIYEQLVESSQDKANSDYASRMLEAVIEIAEFEYAEVTVEDYQEDVINGIKGHLAQQIGLSFEQYLNIVGKTREEFRDEYRESAIQRLHNTLAMTAIAEAENITIEAEDIGTEINMRIDINAFNSMNRPQTFDLSDYLEDIAADIISKRTLKRLVEIGKGEAPELETKAEDSEENKSSVANEPDTDVDNNEATTNDLSKSTETQSQTEA